MTKTGLASGSLETRLSIGGEWTAAASRDTASSVDPATGRTVGSFSAAGRPDAETAVAVARAAFDGTLWARQPRDRQMVLLRWADAMEAQAEKLARLLTETNGKPLAHARGEIAGSVSEIRYYAGLARHNPGHSMEVAPGEYSVMMREPAGVAGLIIPWNAPAVLLIRSLAPALAAGCTVVIKPAPQTAILSLACLAPLLDDPCLPAGAVNVLPEEGNEVAEYLVASQDVDVISFTGSNAVGARIMAAAAPTMKKLSLELGGKSCCIVLEDVDIAAVAPKLAAAATIISGQQCTAARRVLVHAGKLAEMRDALSTALQATVIGDGRCTEVMMGPLIDQPTRDRVAARIAQAEKDADQVALRAEIPGGHGDRTAFLSPSLIVHGDENAYFCQEEIFGPMVVLEPFETELEAVYKANNTEYGLSASVWTNRNDVAWRFARELKDGTIWINDHNKLFAEAETGGYRRSGLGRLHGFDALLDFCELKHIYQNVGLVGHHASA